MDINNSPAGEFRFDYQKYDNKQLSVEDLDKIFKSFSAPTTSLTSQIVLMIKLIAFSLYAWTRRGLVNDKMLIEKQEYQTKRIQSQRRNIEEDDLDQLRIKDEIQEGVSGGNA